MKERNQRKIGTVLSYATVFVNTIVQLLYTPFLIRMLGQSEYGLYSLVSSIIGYLTVLDLGFGNAIIVYTARYRAQNKKEEEKKLHGMFAIIFCIIGGIAAVLGIALFFLAPAMFSHNMSAGELQTIKIMMLILTFNLSVTFPMSIYSSILSAYEEFTFQKVVSILNSLLRPLLMIPLLFLGFKSIAMTVVITVINIAVLISNYLYCKKKLKVKIQFSGFDKKLFQSIFSYSFFIFLAIIVDKANWSVDQFVLGAVSGTVAVSIYSIASQLNQLFINLSTAVSGVFLPKMSNLVANNATSEQLTDEMIKVGRIQYFVIFLICSGLVLFGREFLIFWAGKEYELSYYVALILIIPVCFPLIQNLGLSIMQAMNKYKFKAISTFLMAIVNVVISIFLAKEFGAVGSAIGTAITLILCNIILINIYYKKVIGLDVLRFWKEILKMTGSFLIPIALILLLMNFTRMTGITSVIVYGSIYTILYGIVSYLFAMNSYEKAIANKVLKKLHLIK